MMQKRNAFGERTAPKARLSGRSLILFQRFRQGLGQLVGAAGGLPAALDALQLGDGLLRGHILDQAANTLQIAVAAAGEADGADDAVLQLQIDPGGTHAGRRISIVHAVGLLYDKYYNVSIADIRFVDKSRQNMDDNFHLPFTFRVDESLVSYFFARIAIWAITYNG